MTAAHRARLPAAIGARLGVGLLLAFGLVALGTTDARAGVDDFEIVSFDARYELGRDADGHATLLVTETIVARFPQIDQNRGMYRDIPDDLAGIPLETQAISVVDENGDPVPYETEYYLDFYSIALGDDEFVHGDTTYVITYSQVDVVRPFADTGADEFYWDVNGTGWTQPFGEVSAEVVISDPDLQAALASGASCYQGPSGSTDTCTSGITQRVESTGVTATVISASTGALDPGETLTIAVPFAPGTFEPGAPPTSPPSTATPAPTAGPVTPPGPGSPADPFVASVPALVVSILSTLGILVLGAVAWGRVGGGRAHATSTIVPQYAPLELLPPLAGAMLVGRGSAAVPAQLVSLVVRGRLRLLVDPQPPAASTGYLIELADDRDLDGMDRQFVDALFGAGQPVGVRKPVLRTADAVTSAKLLAMQRDVSAWLDRSGVWQGRARPTSSIVLGVLAVLLVPVSWLSSLLAGASGFVVGSFGFVTSVLGVVFAILAFVGRRGYGPVGAQWTDHLLGLRDYLQLAEADRLRVLQSVTGAERIRTDDAQEMVKLYERLLPWAMVWGVESSWVAELESRLLAAGTTTTWTSSLGAVQQGALRSALFALNTGGRAFATPPVNSGSAGRGFASASSSRGFSSFRSSGFSSSFGGSRGGGFSGGGGGGGGGRGR